MAPADPPVRIQTLPDRTDLPHGLAVVSLPMTAHDRRRVRRLLDAPDGMALALELPTGTILHPGQVLHRTATAAYVVTAADEEVLVARPRSIGEAARIAHMIGNLHRDIQVDGAEIVALADATLADRLAKTGVPVEQTWRPFHGRAPGEHSH